MENTDRKYCRNLLIPSRLITREVRVGEVPMGAEQPVRIQSMTNTATLDITGTVEQASRLFELGCDYVRITARNRHEALALKKIKKLLKERGWARPLIADIHFNPEVALLAAPLVEKIRINPGNYSDRPGKKGHKQEWSEQEYREELERAAERLFPLIQLCKSEGTAIRVGTNHGSLSRRILSRYGNTAEGMVQSAMEFVRLISGMGFHQLVLSMKSSNIRTMLQATRRLVNVMHAEGFDYPLHLGVTEAGAGQDGLIRSAAGIGALLLDGIGDTIRVSLTGDPEQEVGPARYLASLMPQSGGPEGDQVPFDLYADPFFYQRQSSENWENLGGGFPIQIYNSEQEIPEGFPQSHIIPASLPEARKKILQMKSQGVSAPLIIRFKGGGEHAGQELLHFSAEAAALLADGYGDAVWFDAPHPAPAARTGAGETLLQVMGLTRTKAEYISCPTCGRTEFNIMKVLEEVRALTSHMKHLKIAVMGCIVNGPGEMADADYGIVGMGKESVALYAGGKLVMKGVSEEEAAKKLFEIITGNKYNAG